MNIQADLMQFFVYRKLVNRKEAPDLLDEAKKKGMPIREYLLAKEITTENLELEALADYYCLPFAELDLLDVDGTLVSKFSVEFLKKQKILPVSIDKNGVLLVATGRPLDFNTMSSMSMAISAPIDVVLTPPRDIDRYLDSISAAISTSSALSDLNNEEDDGLIPDIKLEAADVGNLTDVVNNPQVRLVDSVIKESIPYRASDIHIEPFDKKVRVRYRIDGDLHERAEIPISAYSAICARIKIMAGMDIAERRIPQDGRIGMKIGGKEYDFRVSSLPSVHGEKFVIRILDKSAFHFTRSDLGFTDEENRVIDRMITRPHGIILLTGPTGCGKSTTLYSFLKEINDPKINIITVEDPVEYTMPGITQTQVNAKANMTFAAALRSILRQDPDAIMLGEIRDEETAEIAVRAAITGHLVFSTLHTNDAPGAVTRLVDMGVPDYLVADALCGVIAQRLVKRLCPVCKKRGKTNAKEMEILGVEEPINIFRPQGCQFCNNSGYKGRIAVHEIMYMSEELKVMLLEGKNSEEIKEASIKQGMVTLWTSCRELVIKGLTSTQELMELNSN